MGTAFWLEACGAWRAAGLILLPPLRLGAARALGPTCQMLSRGSQEVQAVLVLPWLSAGEHGHGRHFLAATYPAWLPVWGSPEVVLVASWSPDRCSVVCSQTQ